MARKDDMHTSSKSAKVGRNDPCPCGSGKKYKQCCLLTEQDASRERRTALETMRCHPELIFNKLLSSIASTAASATAPDSWAESDDPLAMLWKEFREANYEDKIALFTRALENEDIDLDGEIAFAMFDVFYPETLKRDERERFNDLVQVLSQAAPDLYAKKRPYLLGWVIANAIALGHREEVAKRIREMG